jgi:hypothetical protein
MGFTPLQRVTRWVYGWMLRILGAATVAGAWVRRPVLGRILTRGFNVDSEAWSLH